VSEVCCLSSGGVEAVGARRYRDVNKKMNIPERRQFK